jgi:hypothetical protein
MLAKSFEIHFHTKTMYPIAMFVHVITKNILQLNIHIPMFHFVGAMGHV